MDITRRAAEDIRNVRIKKTKTTPKKNVPTEPNDQTTYKTIQPFEKLAICTKEIREIMEVKYRRNITFHERKRIVKTCVKDNIYADATKKMNLMNNNHNQTDKYRIVNEKLMQQGSNDRLKFQEALKQKRKKTKPRCYFNKNKKSSCQILITLKISSENSKSSTKINSRKEKSQRSPISPLIPKTNPEPNTKAKHILITPTKIEPFPPPYPK